jgi:hypothetical protein
MLGRAENPAIRCSDSTADASSCLTERTRVESKVAGYAIPATRFRI